MTTSETSAFSKISITEVGYCITCLSRIHSLDELTREHEHHDVLLYSQTKINYEIDDGQINEYNNLMYVSSIMDGLKNNSTNMYIEINNCLSHIDIPGIEDVREVFYEPLRQMYRRDDEELERLKRLSLAPREIQCLYNVLDNPKIYRIYDSVLKLIKESIRRDSLNALVIKFIHMVEDKFILRLHRLNKYLVYDSTEDKFRTNVIINNFPSVYKDDGRYILSLNGQLSKPIKLAFGSISVNNNGYCYLSSNYLITYVHVDDQCFIHEDFIDTPFIPKTLVQMYNTNIIAMCYDQNDKLWYLPTLNGCWKQVGLMYVDEYKISNHIHTYIGSWINPDPRYGMYISLRRICVYNGILTHTLNPINLDDFRILLAFPICKYHILIFDGEYTTVIRALF